VMLLPVPVPDRHCTIAAAAPPERSAPTTSSSIIPAPVRLLANVAVPAALVGEPPASPTQIEALCVVLIATVLASLL